MKVKSLIVAALLMAPFAAANACFAQESPSVEIYRFVRETNVKVRDATGYRSLPDTFSHMETLTNIGYKVQDRIWNVDYQKNQVSYRKYIPLFSNRTQNGTEKTPSEVVQIIQEKLPAPFQASDYQSSPLVFMDTDTRCQTATYSPFCGYKNSYIVLYPFNFQGHPVLHDDLSRVGLTIVLDKYTGDILAVTGLVNFQADSIRLPTAMTLSSSQPVNAYILTQEKSDFDAYLIPVHRDTKIHLPGDINTFGFHVMERDAPAFIEESPSVESESMEETSTAGETPMDSLRISLSPDAGIEVGAVIKSKLYSWASVTQQRARIGKLFILEGRNLRLENLWLRRGAKKIFENGSNSVFLSPHPASKELLFSKQGFFQFQ